MIYEFLILLFNIIILYFLHRKPLLYFKLEEENAQIPKRATSGSVGYDLYASEDIIIKAHDKNIVSTGISTKIPQGYYGRISPRSSLTVNHFIDIGAGVIDPDYRGIIKVVLFNFSDNDFHVKIGDRIAQLIIEKVLVTNVIQIHKNMNLDKTDRGTGGFGSTGK